MSSVHVKAIEALEALRSALLQFKSDGTNSLEAMRAESRRTIAWLEERQRHWQRELQHRSEKLRQARAALSACQRDHGDCSHEATMVQRAQRDVQEAEQRLATVRLHLKRVIQANEEYEREARRLINMFSQELLQGTTLLKTSFTSLSYYAGGGNQANWVEIGGDLAGVIISEVTQPSSSSAVINGLRNTDNFLPGSLEHIFEGEINGARKAVGYHYEGLPNTPGRIVPGTAFPPNAYGIYLAKVEVNGVSKKDYNGYSSFFPTTMLPQEVVDTINDAYNVRHRISPTSNLYVGLTSSGMLIYMHLHAGKISSAYPHY